MPFYKVFFHIVIPDQPLATPSGSSNSSSPPGLAHLFLMWFPLLVLSLFFLRWTLTYFGCAFFVFGRGHSRTTSTFLQSVVSPLQHSFLIPPLFCLPILSGHPTHSSPPRQFAWQSVSLGENFCVMCFICVLFSSHTFDCILRKGSLLPTPLSGNKGLNLITPVRPPPPSRSDHPYSRGRRSVTLFRIPLSRKTVPGSCLFRVFGLAKRSTSA